LLASERQREPADASRSQQMPAKASGSQRERKDYGIHFDLDMS
jgi:hypothetical protein